MKFKKLYIISSLVGFTETLQVLVLIPFLSVVGSIIDGRQIQSELIWISNILNINVILLTTIFTVFFIVTLNLLRAYLAYKRYLFLHLTRNFISNKILSNINDIKNFGQDNETKERLLTIFSTEIESYVVSYIQPKTILYQSGISLLLVIFVIIFILPIKVMFGVIFLGIIYYVLTMYFKEINIKLGNRRYALNQKRLTFAELISNANFELDLYKKREAASKALSTITHELAVITGRAHFYTQAPKYFIEAITFSLLALLIFSFNQTSQLENSNTLYVLGSSSIALYKAIPALQAVYQNYTGLKFGEAVKNKLLPYLNSDVQVSSGQQIKFKSLELKNISVKYDGITLFENINLKIKKNDKIAIIGESGTGKTTLLYILMGIMQDYSGKCLVNGKSIDQINHYEYMRSFSYVPNKSIDLNLIDRALGTTDIELNDKNNFSTGELQRALINIAESKQADLFFLDEFTSAQDHNNQFAIIKRLIKKRDVTILSIVHRLETLEYYDSVYRLNGKELIREK